MLEGSVCSGLVTEHSHTTLPHMPFLSRTNEELVAFLSKNRDKRNFLRISWPGQLQVMGMVEDALVLRSRHKPYTQGLVASALACKTLQTNHRLRSAVLIPGR